MSRRLRAINFVLTIVDLILALVYAIHYRQYGGTNYLVAALVLAFLALVHAFVFSYVRINVVDKQVAEDTCVEHGVFCCPECFDMNDASRDPGTETEESS